MATAAERYARGRSRTLIAAVRRAGRVTLAHGQAGKISDHVVARSCRVAGALRQPERRRGDSRGCCGMLGQPIPLATAIQDAALRTVWDDARFPPVSATEVDHLDLEVWLLQGPTPVPARGAERAAAVQVGKHGIQVMRGQQHGLFLPSVAIDSGWDSVRLSRSGLVRCRLAADRSGRRCHGPVHVSRGMFPCGRLGDRRRCVASSTPRRRLRRGTSECVCELLLHQHQCPFDRRHAELLLRWRPRWQRQRHHLELVASAGAGEGAAFFTDLAAPWFGVAKHAVVAVPERRPDPGRPAALPAGSRWRFCKSASRSLHDPTMHGTVADPHLAGVDPQHRALLVLERNKSAIVFDPAKQPPEGFYGSGARGRQG